MCGVILFSAKYRELMFAFRKFHCVRFSEIVSPIDYRLGFGNQRLMQNFILPGVGGEARVNQFFLPTQNFLTCIL